VQPNAAWADVLIAPLVAALAEVTGVSTVIVNGTGRARVLEGLAEVTIVALGTAPNAPVAVPMNGAIYLADVMVGQKTGLFYDQRPNHAFAAGLVVCDPPAFAPSKRALDAGLRAYERVARLAAPLVAPGGYLILCSCSHAVDLGAFRAACGRGIGRALFETGRRAQLIHTGFAGPDHPQLPQLAESGYLKALFFRL
jgi:23S rRNA (cytosine1962-C5)-methyltransferase